MKFKKIVGIGDSWTFGEGSVNLSDKEAQKLQSDTSETVLNVSKKYYDKVTKHSWVKKLSDLYDCDYKVIAVPGCSNESIMNNFYKHKKEFDRKTLVVIMWSSKFRDKLLALPNFDLAKVAQMIEKAKADDYYTGNISFEEQIARNKRQLEQMGITEATWND